MRTEAEMMALILEVAQRDDRIRAVGMNGSRVNENVKQDDYQDYDIVYLVTDVDSFVTDRKWIDVFGERLIMQTPEGMSLFPAELAGKYTYLMQFTDGTRIDLMLIPIAAGQQYCMEDSLTVILLDKDNRLPKMKAANDSSYWIEKPTSTYYADCCNEFWWLSLSVAKGLQRGETLFALAHLELMRSMLVKMIEWKVGHHYNYAVNPGKNGKFLKSLSSESTWEKLMSTFPLANEKSIKAALFAAGDLFFNVSQVVGSALDYEYAQENIRTFDYIKELL